MKLRELDLVEMCLLLYGGMSEGVRAVKSDEEEATEAIAVHFISDQFLNLCCG